jgi:hypothetical protein
MLHDERFGVIWAEYRVVARNYLASMREARRHRDEIVRLRRDAAASGSQTEAEHLMVGPTDIDTFKLDHFEKLLDRAEAAVKPPSKTRA